MGFLAFFRMIEKLSWMDDMRRNWTLLANLGCPAPCVQVNKKRKRKILNTEIKDGTYNILVQGMTKLNEKDKVKAKCVETDSFDFHPDIF